MRFVADENFNNDILRGIKRLCPHIEIVRVQDTPMIRADDRALLAWIADEPNTILLSHDVNTIPKYFYERAKANLTMPTVMMLHAERPLSEGIEALVMLIEASSFDEWRGDLTFLPL